MLKRYAVLGLLLFAAGCVNPPPEPSHVYISTPELANYTVRGTPRAYRENGILHVSVPITDVSVYDLHIDYRITFFDSTGRVIYQSGWEARTIYRNVPTEIAFNSTSADATDWQLDLRYAQ
jgi:hypothetical protein